ncbi:MAG: hypothetical protein GY806_13415 [Gammaproteobacteria bacterium]|nr:hypothetical protein [Gammaproteobacteria bacterium]
MISVFSWAGEYFEGFYERWKGGRVNVWKGEFESGFKRINSDMPGDVFLFRNRAYFHTWKEGSYLRTEKSKEYEWPFPRILIRQGGYMFGFEESFSAGPACEIGYRQ